MNFVGSTHDRYIHNRRVRVLRDHFVALLPQGASVLDIGCGDGLLANSIMQERPDINIKGIDVLVRDRTHIQVDKFDGQAIPHADGMFDVVMFIDVLHHTEDPMILLREARRVARKAILMKDHTCNGLFDNLTLQFMDWVGNARHGVVLPYNYWPHQRWLDAFKDLNLRIDVWVKDLKIYPLPADWVFGRSLHFVSRLDKSREADS